MTSTQSKPSHGKGRECVITRRACFSSSHRYWLPEKSPEENLSLFGKCSFAPGHGHNYELIVSMGGELDSDGMVLNLSDVKHSIKESKSMYLYFNNSASFKPVCDLPEPIIPIKNMLLPLIA